MRKIAVLYHSGVGSTKVVAEKIHAHLAASFPADLHSVEALPGDFSSGRYDAFAIGAPVIHAHPSERILAFLESLPRPARPKPAFFFTTCGLYSANATRILADRAARRGILPVLGRSYRCPASDGSLILPIDFFFSYERRLDEKIAADCARFAAVLSGTSWRPRRPRFKLYSILNAPNKYAGMHITFPIHPHPDRCTGCGRCADLCPSGAMVSGPGGFPVFHAARCEKCYRCIHHCPAKALSLSRRRAPARVRQDYL